MRWVLQLNRQSSLYIFHYANKSVFVRASAFFCRTVNFIHHVPDELVTFGISQTKERPLRKAFGLVYSNFNLPKGQA